MSPHFRYDKSEIILRLSRRGVGQMSRLTGAQKSNVSRQDWGVPPTPGESGIWRGRRMPRV